MSRPCAWCEGEATIGIGELGGLCDPCFDEMLGERREVVDQILCEVVSDLYAPGARAFEPERIRRVEVIRSPLFCSEGE